MIIPKDYRIFEAILFNIQLFERKKLDLSSLVNELNSFYREVSDVDNMWSKSFFENWMNLETINAEMIENDKTEIPDVYNNFINQSLKKIKQITEELLKRDLNRNDLSNYDKAEIIDQDWLICSNCIDAWESASITPMIRCPKCKNIMHNPRYKE